MNSALLGSLVEIKGGGTPRRDLSEYWGGSIPWATVKDFVTTELKSTQESITELGVSKSATNIIPAGNIIVPTRMALGKAAINLVDLAINQDLKALIPIDPQTIDRDYLFRFLLSKAHYIESLGKGATVKGIRLDALKELKVPLPPIAEQKHIAAILDKADVIRHKRRKAIQLADEFLRSVFLDMFGDPVANPKGFNSASLGDLVEIISGGTPSKAEKRFWNGIFPWVSPKDMKSITINNSIDKISENVFSETTLKRIPQKSILIVIRGMILVHTIPIAITEKEVAINQDIKALIPKQSIVPQFLLWSLIVMHNFLLSKVSTAAHGTKRLDTTDLLQIKILLPITELQNKFTEIVYKFSKINDQTAFSLEEAENLFHSLAQKAFRGEL